MFNKIKGVKEKKQLTDLMTFIVQSTQAAAGRGVIPASFANEINKQEPTYIKILSEPDVAGNVTVAATPEGISAVTGEPVAAVAAAPKASAFQLETGFTVPETKRGGGLKGETYPFAQMEVGHSFFVAATDDKPNPAKALASTVSSANKRFATVYPAMKGKNPHPQAGQPTGKDGRTFTVRARTVDDKEKQNGARVYRVS